MAPSRPQSVPRAIAVFRPSLLGASFVLLALLAGCGSGSEGSVPEETSPDVTGETSEPEADATIPGESSSSAPTVIVNDCGGLRPLQWQGDGARAGEGCGPFDEGTLVCAALDVLRCIGLSALNECGTPGELPVEIGASCGPCAGIDEDAAGVWVCGQDGIPTCIGARDPNACGGCAGLDGRPGGLCDDGAGRWVCGSREALTCRGPGENACGGDGVLRFDGQPALPGDGCDAGCGDGVLVCDGEGGLECIAGDLGLPPNACGGCGALPGRVGATCGPCGGGTWTCDGQGAMFCDGPTAPDGCGACTARAERPGQACGVDGIWQCAGVNLHCGSVVRPEERNPCGGTEALAAEPGTGCGTCGDGLHVCTTPNAVQCLGGENTNACGGCTPLRGSLRQPCGTCGSGELACGDDGSSLRCDGDLGDDARNPCGRCSELPVDIGDSCGSCLEWTCGPTGGVRCELNTALTGCGFRTCADLDCTARNRSCVPSDGSRDARCDVCLPGFGPMDGQCVAGATPGSDVPTSGQPTGEPTSGQPTGEPTSGQPTGEPTASQPVGWTPSGLQDACINSADGDVLTINGDFIFGDLLGTCANDERDLGPIATLAARVAACVDSGSALSADCSMCLGDSVACAVDRCAEECDEVGDNFETCEACLDVECDPHFLTCTGFEGDGEPGNGGDDSCACRQDSACATGEVCVGCACVDATVPGTDYTFSNVRSFVHAFHLPGIGDSSGIACCRDYSGDGLGDSAYFGWYEAAQRSLFDLPEGGDVLEERARQDIASLMFEWRGIASNLVVLDPSGVFGISIWPVVDAGGDGAASWPDRRDGNGTFQALPSGLGPGGARAQFNNATLSGNTITAGPSVVPALGWIPVRVSVFPGLADPEPEALAERLRGLDLHDVHLFIQVQSVGGSIVSPVEEFIGLDIGGGELGGLLLVEDLIALDDGILRECTCAGINPDQTVLMTQTTASELQVFCNPEQPINDTGCGAEDPPFCEFTGLACSTAGVLASLADVDSTGDGIDDAISVGVVFGLTGAGLGTPAFADDAP
ncbi:MAG: hypothetical protein EA398_02125 [Deltaproteobacteria bacterium]|nr:MAG: hypothetical protein EA398_02125 [Deltaproteobacteria bacterium]